MRAHEGQKEKAVSLILFTYLKLQNPSETRDGCENYRCRINARRTRRYRNHRRTNEKKEFGEEIVFLVKGVTKLGTLKYRGHERHVESLRKFFVAMANDLRVVIIKFADRLHNLKTLEYVNEEKTGSHSA